MTRKKTTTGTMGSKRKTDVKPAKAAPTGDKAGARKAEQKANEVIPEVAVALLTTYPALPDKGMILEQFSSHFRGAKERAEVAAAAAAAAAQQAEAESERSRGGQRKRRPTVEPISRPQIRPQPSQPVSRPMVRPSSEVIRAAELVRPVASAPVVAPAPEPEPVSAFAAFDAETQKPAEVDDLFGLLNSDGQTKSEDDFDFSYQTTADQSSPFLAAPLADKKTGEGATVMTEAVEDDLILGTPISAEALSADVDEQLIAPHESTTMIQAMPDEEPSDDAASRKSRKSSRKRRG